MQYTVMFLIIVLCGCSSRTTVVVGRMANPEMLGEKELVDYNSIVYSNGIAQSGGKYERSVYRFSVIPVLKSDTGEYSIWKRRARWAGDPFMGGQHFKDSNVVEWIEFKDRFGIEIPVPDSGNVMLVFKSITEPGKYGYVSVDNVPRITCDEIVIEKLYQPVKKVLELVQNIPDAK